MENIVEINNLNFKYKKELLFENLNLKIKKGDFVTICGTGKTTLVKLIKDRKNNKNIVINGKMCILMSDLYNNFYDETVEKNIIRKLKNNKFSDKQIKEKINEFIKNFNLKNILDYNPKYLSYGEKALISIIIALAENPDVIIFDETFSMIDLIKKEKILKYLKKYNKEKSMTIINFSNNLEESLFSKRVILMDKNIKLNKTIKKAFDNIDIYNDLNLELPFIVNLSNKLRYYDLVDNNFLDMDKLVNYLWK